jgi:hypothetical protein
MKILKAGNGKSSKRTRKFKNFNPTPRKYKAGDLVYSVKEFDFVFEKKKQIIIGECWHEAVPVDDYGKPIQIKGKSSHGWILNPVICSDLDGEFYSLPGDAISEDQISGHVTEPEMIETYKSVLEDKLLHKTDEEYFELLQLSFDKAFMEKAQKEFERGID